MADAMDTLKSILGDGAEDKIKNVMSSLSSSDEASSPAIDTDSMEQIVQLKNIMDSVTKNRNDPRSNLLMSLKPYMRDGRKRSIDSAVRFLGLANLTKMLRK